MVTETRSKETAIIALTATGAKLAFHIAPSIEDAVVFVPQRLQNHVSPVPGLKVEYFSEWEPIFSRAFRQFSYIVCIMAAGIVVRTLASLLVSKYQDPAVVVTDEKGRYVISLLSGHIGGGNALAHRVAAITRGQAVITTATDVHEKPALDLLAQKMGAKPEPLMQVKKISRMLVENQTVNLYSNLPLVISVTRGFQYCGWPWGTMLRPQDHTMLFQRGEALTVKENSIKEPAVIISHQIVHRQGLTSCIRLVPQNLVMGIGCRRGVELDQLQTAIQQVIAQYHLSPASISALATIDFKTGEPGLQLMAQKMELPLIGVSKDQIMALEGTYTPSHWVYENIGVGGVCEPAALIVASRGYLMVPKQKIGPVTISIAMAKSWWLDWDRETGIF